MTEILSLTFVLILSAVPLTALLALLPYLLPARTARTQQVWHGRSRRAFWLGLANFIFFGLLATMFAQGGDFGGLLSLLILLTLAAFAFIGLGGLVRLLQNRIFTQETFATALKTAVLLTLALFTPLIGWFVLAPILLITSLGTALLGWRQPKQPPIPMP
jgi:MFS family permease